MGEARAASSSNHQQIASRLDAIPSNPKLLVHTQDYPFLEVAIWTPEERSNEHANSASFRRLHAYAFNDPTDFWHVVCTRKVVDQCYFKRFPSHVAPHAWSSFDQNNIFNAYPTSMQPQTDLMYSSGDAHFMDPIPPEHIYPVLPRGCTEATMDGLPAEYFLKYPCLVTYDPAIHVENVQPMLNNIAMFEFFRQRPHPNIARYYGCVSSTLPCFACSGQDNHIRDKQTLAVTCPSCSYHPGECTEPGHVWSYDYVAAMRCRCNSTPPFRVRSLVLGYYPIQFKERFTSYNGLPDAEEIEARKVVLTQLWTTVQHIWQLGFCINNLTPDSIRLTGAGEPIITDLGECLRQGTTLPGTRRYEWAWPGSSIWKDAKLFGFRDVSCRENDIIALERLKKYLGCYQRKA
ncbi:MAG: hypothetical protein Q9165_008658 [Trypethelium subeluteriae]